MFFLVKQVRINIKKMANTKPAGILCLKDHWLESHSELFHLRVSSLYNAVFCVPGDTEIYNIVSVKGKGAFHSA